MHIVHIYYKQYVITRPETLFELVPRGELSRPVHTCSVFASDILTERLQQLIVALLEMLCKIELVGILLSLCGTCTVGLHPLEGPSDGIQFVRMVTRNTIYEKKIRLLYGCPHADKKVRIGIRLRHIILLSYM